MKNTKTVALLAIGLLVLVVVAVTASRQFAMVRANAFMRDHLTEKWVRLYCAPALWSDAQFMPSWDVVYETEGLTGTPPHVRVSLLGRIMMTNVDREDRLEESIGRAVGPASGGLR